MSWKLAVPAALSLASMRPAFPPWAAASVLLVGHLAALGGSAAGKAAFAAVPLGVWVTRPFCQPAFLPFSCLSFFFCCCFCLVSVAVFGVDVTAGLAQAREPADCSWPVAKGVT